MNSCQANSVDLGDRWRALLRDHVYVGSHKAKRIAADWNVSVSLAKLWLAGGKPTSDQIARAHAMWGPVVIQFLFGAMPMRSVDERLSAVEQSLAALKSGLEATKGEDHSRADAAIPYVASGSECSPRTVVEADQGSVGRRLWLAQLAEKARRERRSA